LTLDTRRATKNPLGSLQHHNKSGNMSYGSQLLWGPPAHRRVWDNTPYDEEHELTTPQADQGKGYVRTQGLDLLTDGKVLQENK